MTDENALFSRNLGARQEKLTVIPPLTIRQTESLARDIEGLANLRGMEKSEYIRHLVIQDKLEQQRIWAARNQLFALGGASAINTANDEVSQ